MTKPLRNYQQATIDKISDCIQAGLWYFILADEGGLGKTRTVLEFVDQNCDKFELRYVWIACPPALKANWIVEIKNWLPGPGERNYTICFVPYTDFNAVKFAMSHTIDLLILDEGHYLKSFDSLRTRVFIGAPGEGRKLIGRAKYTIDVTATPTPNRVGEIYPFLWGVQADMIRRLTYEDFVRLYAEKVNATKFGLTHRGIKNPEQFLRDKPFFMRRLIDDVATEIPQGTSIRINLPVDRVVEEDEKIILAEMLLRAEFKTNDIDYILSNPDYLELLLSTTPGFVDYSEFRKRQGFIKIPAVLEYVLETVLPEHQKFILLTYHTDILKIYVDKLQPFLRKSKIDFTVIDDSVDVNDRVSRISKADGEERHVIFSTIGKFREGFTCVNFRHTLFVELDWRWYVIRQACYRTRRIGSTKPMFYYFFPFERGMDQKILDVFDEKRETTAKIYGDV